MFNLDEELKSLLGKYGLALEKDESQKLYELYLDTFKKVWSSIPDDEPIAIFGMGMGFSKLYPIIQANKKNVVCIIENSRVTKKFSIDMPVIKTDNIPEYFFTKVILTGFKYKEDMRKVILGTTSDANIIDIYDILSNRGIYYERPFFNTVFPYFKIYETRIEYDSARNKAEKQIKLKNLIKLYLDIRDFVYSEKFIAEYIAQEFDDSESLKFFNNELIVLFEKAKRAILNKRESSILLFVLDFLSHESSDKMEFVTSQRAESLVFTKAFSVFEHTVGSFSSFLTGKYFNFDNEAEKICKNRTLFLKQFKDRGFKFKYVAPPNMQFLSAVNEFDGSRHDTQPQLYWSFLNDYIMDDGKSFAVIHSLYETHRPYYHGYAKNKLVDYEQYYISEEAVSSIKSQAELEDLSQAEQAQYTESLDYADKQLEFYMSFLSDKDLTAIMSDHGSLFLKQFYNYYVKGITVFDDVTFHTVFQIRNNKIKPGIFDGLFSYIDLLDLFGKILWDDQNFKWESKEYVKICSEPTYSTTLLRLLKKLPDFEKRYYHKGYIGAKTLTDKYLRFLDGHEHYYILPNEDFDKDNLIGHPEYANRIEYLRNIVEDLTL